MRIKSSKIFSILSLAIFISNGCGDNQKIESNRLDMKGELSLKGEYKFKITHQWDQNTATVPQFPNDKLLDSDYKIVNEDIFHTFQFSDNGDRVKIIGKPYIKGPITGNRSIKSNTYKLQTFAGGHLIIWKDNEIIKAELRFYGSGFPVILSEIGLLVKK